MNGVLTNLKCSAILFFLWFINNHIVLCRSCRWAGQSPSCDLKERSLPAHPVVARLLTRTVSTQGVPISPRYCINIFYTSRTVLFEEDTGLAGIVLGTQVSSEGSCNTQEVYLYCLGFSSNTWANGYQGGPEDLDTNLWPTKMSMVEK